MTAWWLPDNCLTTIQQLFDYLSDNCLKNNNSELNFCSSKLSVTKRPLVLFGLEDKVRLKSNHSTLIKISPFSNCKSFPIFLLLLQYYRSFHMHQNRWCINVNVRPFKWFSIGNIHVWRKQVFEIFDPLPHPLVIKSKHLAWPPQ